MQQSLLKPLTHCTFFALNPYPLPDLNAQYLTKIILLPSFEFCFLAIFLRSASQVVDKSQTYEFSLKNKRGL